MMPTDQIKRRADRWAAPLLTAGVIGVAWRNWRAWQRDRAQADQIRSARGPTLTLDRQPKISALVAAWNEAERIDAHIRSFLALGYADIELILCAGGSDRTFDRARRYASDRVIVIRQQPGEGKQRALARCYKRATGDLIFLTDADCLFSDDALVRLIDPVVNDGEHAATGTSRPLADQIDRLVPRWVWSAEVAANARHGCYSQGLLGRNAVVTRQALDLIGGLDFGARTGTDYQLARRLLAAGVRIRHVGSSVVPSAYANDLRVYRHKQSRWLRNLLIHGRRTGARADVRATQRTVVTGAAMLIMPLLSFLFGPLVIAGWIALIAHAAASKLRYIAFAARLDDRSIPRRLIINLVPLTLIDCAIWASPIIDLIHPKRREQW